MYILQTDCLILKCSTSSYNRFIQSKDLSSKSAEDMACIFGQRSKSVPGTPQEQSEVSLMFKILFNVYHGFSVILLTRI